MQMAKEFSSMIDLISVFCWSWELCQCASIWSWWRACSNWLMMILWGFLVLVVVVDTANSQAMEAIWGWWRKCLNWLIITLWGFVVVLVDIVDSHAMESRANLVSINTGLQAVTRADTICELALVNFVVRFINQFLLNVRSWAKLRTSCKKGT